MSHIKTAKTKRGYEYYLNGLYSDSYSEDQAIDSLIYLTSKNRTPRTTVNNLRDKYQKGQLGTLLRQLDPIAFNCGFNDYSI